MNEAAHVIVAVGDLKEWRSVNTLGMNLGYWQTHRLNKYTNNRNAPHLNETELLSEVNKVSPFNLEILPEDRESMNKLVGDITKRYIDRTFVQEDYDATFSTFTDNNHFQLSAGHSESAPQATVEAQQTTAYYLSADRLATQAWSAITCFAIVAGHGQIVDRKLNLCYETKSKDGTAEEKKHWPVAKYWCDWLSFVTKYDLSGRRLVLVLDICHAGAAIDELREWCDNQRKILTQFKCSVQLYTCCSKYELARGGYYLQTWLAVHKLRKMDSSSYTASGTSMVDTLEQNPQYFSSDSDLVGYPEVLSGVDLFNNWHKLIATNNKSEHLNIERFYRGAADTQLTILKSQAYDIVDVKPFVSGKTGECDGYQFAAIIKANGIKWSQHVHLCSTTLESKRQWTVSSKKGSSAKKIDIIQSENDAFVRVDKRVGSYFMAGFSRVDETENSQKGEEDTVQYKIPNEDFASMDKSITPYVVATDTRIVECGKIGTLEESHTVKANMGEVYSTFIDKVQTFLKEHEDRKLYICEFGAVSVADWLVKCGPTSTKRKATAEEVDLSGDFKKSWNCAASVLGLFRTRFAET